jgi:hypothetical protein
LKPDCLKKNLSALAQNPRHRNKVSPRPFSDEIETFIAKNGQTTLRCNGILIHSAYDPKKEGEKFAQKIQPGSQVCLYGMGLGYHLGPLLERIGPEGSLLVIELNANLLSAAFTLNDLSEVFKDPRFQLIHSDNESTAADQISAGMQFLTETSSKSLEIIFHAPSFKCIPKNFPKLSNALEILLLERRFPAVLGGQEKLNYQKNKAIVQNTPGIKTLKNAHAGQAALLISAGPSLDSIVPHLKYLQKRALIACVDTALPILIQADIVPDYIFTLDPQTENCKHLVELPHQRGTLIFTPTSHPHILSRAPQKKYVAIQQGHSLFKDDPLGAEKGLTQSGGSVACFALDCLIQFGCRPILLAGQDCAFSGGRIYARNALQSLGSMDRFTSRNVYRQDHELKSAQSKTIPVSGTQGREVLTNQAMYGYLRAIESIVLANPEAKIYNLGSQGAKIDRVLNIHSISETILHASSN